MADPSYSLLQNIGAISMTLGTVLLFSGGVITLFSKAPVNMRLLAGFGFVAAALIVSGWMFVSRVIY